MIEFGLTGREIQDSIDVEKYKALAYNTDLGLELTRMVELNWLDWVEKVADTPWTKNWKKSPLYGCEGVKPSGAPFSEPGRGSADNKSVVYFGAIANAIYCSTIWGIGIDNWLLNENSILKCSGDTRLNKLSQALRGKGCTGRTYVNEPMVCMLELQRAPNASSARAYFWDDKLYRGCGMRVPIEIGDLDRWLEPMWLEVVDAARMKKQKEELDKARKQAASAWRGLHIKL